MFQAAILLMLPALASVPTPGEDTDSQQMSAARNGAAPSDPASVRFVHDFGLCAAKGVPNSARDVLRRVPGSNAANRSLFNMATGSNSCVKYDEKLKFAPRFLRGPAAEYYIARDFELPSWKAKGKPLAVYQMPTNAELDKLDADAKADVVMTEIGSCVAKANPAGVAALVASAPTSAEETAAMNALSPALSGCVPPSVNLKISKFQMRGFIAEGAYRAMAGAQSELN